MRTINFIEGVMRSLTTDQKSEIRSSNNDYVNFIISVFNAGAVIRQYKGSSLIDCAKWRAKNRKELSELYGEIREITIKHKDR